MIAWITNGYIRYLGYIIIYLEHWYGDASPAIDITPYEDIITDDGDFTFVANNASKYQMYTYGNFANNPYIPNTKIKSWSTTTTTLAPFNIRFDFISSVGYQINDNLKVQLLDDSRKVVATVSKSYCALFVDPKQFQWPLHVSVKSDVYALDYNEFSNNF